VESENVVLKFKQRGISDVSLESLVGRNLLGFFKLSGQVGEKGQVEGERDKAVNLEAFFHLPPFT
jgi:hypothetical protein